MGGNAQLTFFVRLLSAFGSAVKLCGRGWTYGFGGVLGMQWSPTRDNMELQIAYMGGGQAIDDI